MPDLVLRPGWTDQPIPDTEPSRDHVFDPVYVLRGADLNGWYKETKVPIKAATTRANIAGNQSGDAWRLHATNSAIDLGVTTQLSNSAFAAMFTITPVTLAAPSRLLSTKYNTGLNYYALDLNVGTDGHPNVSMMGVGNIYDGTGGPALVAGKTSTIVYTWTNAAGSRVFVDGRKHGAAGSQGYTFPAFTQVVCGRLAFDHNDTGDFLLHGMAWSNTAQSLPDEVLRDLSANPWAIYEPDDIYLWGTAGGGGGSTDLNAESGSYSITGSNATLAAARSINAGSGSYSITGVNAALTSAKNIVAASGSYSITGADAELSYASSGSLNAESGAYAITGNDVTFKRTYVTNLASGSYAVTGNNATLQKGYGLNAGSGVYSVTGAANAFIYNQVLNASPGSYLITGLDAVLVYSGSTGYELSADPSDYSITGFDVTFTFGGLWTDVPAATGAWTDVTPSSDVWTDI